MLEAHPGVGAGVGVGRVVLPIAGTQVRVYRAIVLGEINNMKYKDIRYYLIWCLNIQYQQYLDLDGAVSQLGGPLGRGALLPGQAVGLRLGQLRPGHQHQVNNI